MVYHHDMLFSPGYLDLLVFVPIDRQVERTINFCLEESPWESTLQLSPYRFAIVMDECGYLVQISTLVLICNILIYCALDSRNVIHKVV